MNTQNLLEVCRQAIKEIDNHIAAHPMDKTKLPEIRALLLKAINETTEAKS